MGIVPKQTLLKANRGRSNEEIRRALILVRDLDGMANPFQVGQNPDSVATAERVEQFVTARLEYYGIPPAAVHIEAVVEASKLFILGILGGSQVEISRAADKSGCSRELLDWALSYASPVTDELTYQFLQYLEER